MSVGRLAENMGKCKRTVQRALRALEREGLIQVIYREHETSMYRVLRPLKMPGQSEAVGEMPETVEISCCQDEIAPVPTPPAVSVIPTTTFLPPQLETREPEQTIPSILPLSNGDTPNEKEDGWNPSVQQENQEPLPVQEEPVLAAPTEQEPVAPAAEDPCVENTPQTQREQIETELHRVPDIDMDLALEVAEKNGWTCEEVKLLVDAKLIDPAVKSPAAVIVARLAQDRKVQSWELSQAQAHVRRIEREKTAQEQEAAEEARKEAQLRQEQEAKLAEEKAKIQQRAANEAREHALQEQLDNMHPQDVQALEQKARQTLIDEKNDNGQPRYRPDLILSFLIRSKMADLLGIPPVPDYIGQAAAKANVPPSQPVRPVPQPPQSKEQKNYLATLNNLVQQLSIPSFCNQQAY